MFKKGEGILRGNNNKSMIYVEEEQRNAADEINGHYGGTLCEYSWHNYLKGTWNYKESMLQLKERYFLWI